MKEYNMTEEMAQNRSMWHIRQRPANYTKEVNKCEENKKISRSRD